MPSETPEPLAGSGVKSVLDVATIEVLLLLTLHLRRKPRNMTRS